MYIAIPLPLEAPRRALTRSDRASRDLQPASRPGGEASSRLPVPSGQARTRRDRLRGLGASLAERAVGLFDNGYIFAGGTVGGAVPSGLLLARRSLR
jgi:hypothetical protein